MRMAKDYFDRYINFAHKVELKSIDFGPIAYVFMQLGQKKFKFLNLIS